MLIFCSRQRNSIHPAQLSFAHLPLSEGGKPSVYFTRMWQLQKPNNNRFSLTLEIFLLQLHNFRSICSNMSKNDAICYRIIGSSWVIGIEYQYDT